MEVQARGGGSYGGGYGASEYGNDYVDPYVVLASLGFGVFLFNIIYNLLNRSVRSVQVSDMNLPLQLSDRPEEFHNMLDNITHNYLEEPWQESWSSVDDDGDGDVEELTSKSSHRLQLLKESVRVGQRVAEAIRRHPASCPKTLLCKLGNDAIAWNRQPALALRAMQLYITSLAHHFGEIDTARYVDQVEKSAETTDFDPHYCDDDSSGPSASDCGLADLMALF
ncbi:uncharacterized protein LOC124199888 [Daphnia pulex]|uniref:uncharacterized protein LOC124199888 n=1 Tax=Daphnia pulex TaxID=6669 RepID=UPI001EDF5A4A|nr:uncharacterized protein LOC124199888 [Daphnia pulex]